MSSAKEKLAAKAMQESREKQDFMERLSPDKKAVKCPTCDLPHGLWYRIGVGGKKSLMFTCNRQKHYWWTEEPDGTVREHFKHVTKSFQAPVMIDGLELPSDWTPAHKSAVAKKAQHQLALPTGGRK